MALQVPIPTPLQLLCPSTTRRLRSRALFYQAPPHEGGEFRGWGEGGGEGFSLPIGPEPVPTPFCSRPVSPVDLHDQSMMSPCGIPEALRRANGPPKAGLGLPSGCMQRLIQFLLPLFQLFQSNSSLLLCTIFFIL